MLAGLAVGVFEDTATAVSRCVKMSDVIEPDMENHRECKNYLRYTRRLRTCCGDLMRRWQA